MHSKRSRLVSKKPSSFLCDYYRIRGIVWERLPETAAAVSLQRLLGGGVTRCLGGGVFRTVVWWGWARAAGLGRVSFGSDTSGRSGEARVGASGGVGSARVQETCTGSLALGTAVRLCVSSLGLPGVLPSRSSAAFGPDGVVVLGCVLGCTAPLARAVLGPAGACSGDRAN